MRAGEPGRMLPRFRPSRIIVHAFKYDTYDAVTLAVLAGLLYGLVKDKPADVLFVGAVVILAALA